MAEETNGQGRTRNDIFQDPNFRAAASVLVARDRLNRQLGKRFSGNRDYYETLGYFTDINFQDYLDVYRREHIAARIVDAPAMGVWRRNPRLQGSEDLQQGWRRLEKSARVLQKLELADRLAGLGEFGVLVIGARDGRSLSQPMGPLDGPQDVLYLSAFPEGSSAIEKVDENPRSPRFGMPLQYSISFEVNDTVHQKQVHHSRVIHIAERTLEDPVRGQPRLKPVFNLFDDMRKVVGGSAEAFWRIADRGLHVNVDPEMELDPDDESNLESEVQDYIHGMRRFLRTRGTEVTPLGSETADPRPPFEVLIDLISGATGIPKRVLTGSEQGQLASQEDRTNWMERLDERTKFFAEPEILRPLIDRLMAVGALPEEEYEVVWPPMESLTEVEQSENARRISAAVNNFQRARSLGEPPMTVQEFRESLGLPREKPEGDDDAATDTE